MRAATRNVLLCLVWLGLQGSSCTQRNVRQVETVEATTLIYVRIPSELTNQHPVAQGEVWECHDVAAKRKAELVSCNAELQQISEIEGTQVEPTPAPGPE